MNKHEFALYCPVIPSDPAFALHDKDLVHRIVNVLRLNVGDRFILFNRDLHISVSIIGVKKNSIDVSVLQKGVNTILQPAIHFLLPILKKDALSAAIYSMVELGANSIQLVMTQKVQRHWVAQELERLKKVAIAAAEQSKNFAFPAIVSPCNLKQALAKIPQDAIKIFFDPQAPTVIGMQDAIKAATSIVLMIGPEGDLTEQEKIILRNQQVRFCALTPTVLRAEQAAAVGLGIVRCMLQNS